MAAPSPWPSRSSLPAAADVVLSALIMAKNQKKKKKKKNTAPSSGGQDRSMRTQRIVFTVFALLIVISTIVTLFAQGF
ncbi:MAG: hypothetical protein BMS9Abin28_1077 [Anaerolineae bacterium]|nr:MAG: hypothetical protein BMS9Abin28_1077 [Anaerolineae bacterium]